MIYYWKYVHPARQAAAEANPEPRQPLPVVAPEPAMPLVRGTLGHVGLAHYYARLREHRAGRDIHAYLSPDAAMSVVASRFANGPGLLPAVSAAVRAYANHYASERSSDFEILDVEHEVETQFHGWRYTARLDLVTREGGKVWFYDHKFVGKIEDKTLRRYTLSGQFLGQVWLGARLCWTGPAAEPGKLRVKPPNALFEGEFGGIKINLIGMTGPRFVRVTPDPAPWTLRRFPGIVKTAEEQIEALKDTLIDEWPAAPSEMTCYTPYGECEWFDACRWGSVR
jgi:hypothetical protein